MRLIRLTDFLPSVMGPTGAGKSTVRFHIFLIAPIFTYMKFINQLLGRVVVKVGSELKSCTTNLQAVDVPADVVNDKLPHQSANQAKKLIIVDTPGFDDTSVDDYEILQRVAKWLADS